MEPSMTEINTDVPHSARVYDYWLGGKDNYEADRALGDAMVAAIPTLPAMARANRAFMERAVRHLAGEGITQFLDIGTGIPTSPNLHEIAQSIEPASRVVYVDNDPLVLAHARALLAGHPEGKTAYIHADLTEPRSILDHPSLAETLDLDRPVALMLVAILMYFTDEQNPRAMVAELMDALPSGSRLVISHPTADFDPDSVAQAVEAATSAGITLVPRTRAQVEDLFAGHEILDPGVVPLATWRPVEPPADPHAVYYYGGIARKR
ncbi:MAG: methyltransferase [Thermomonospora sp. CIF 1]|nr:MAG: methyltransferase [Thermomonospora sp. CIF 1]